MMTRGEKSGTPVTVRTVVRDTTKTNLANGKTMLIIAALSGCVGVLSLVTKSGVGIFFGFPIAAILGYAGYRTSRSSSGFIIDPEQGVIERWRQDLSGRQEERLELSKFHKVLVNTKFERSSGSNSSSRHAYIVRLEGKDEKVEVYRVYKPEEASEKGKALAKLLNVEIYDYVNPRDL